MAKKKKTKPTDPRKPRESILAFSCLHAPYNHSDALEFLSAIKDKYQPQLVVNVGDELDYHAMSFHTSDPGLPSAGYELNAARAVLGELDELFPEVHCVGSNHGDMKYRKAKFANIPAQLLVSYREACGVGPGWSWTQNFTIELPTGQPCYFVHSYSTSARIGAEHLGMCLVQGHYHTAFETAYVSSPGRQYWGATIGCLIDDESMAFAYNQTFRKRPIVGCLVILDGQPYLKKMVLDDKGRWIGKIT